MFSMKNQDYFPALTLALILALFTATGCNKPVRVLNIAGGHVYDTSEYYQTIHSLEGLIIDTVTHPRARQILASGTVDRYDVLVFYDFLPQMPLEDSAIYLELTRKGSEAVQVPVLALVLALVLAQVLAQVPVQAPELAPAWYCPKLARKKRRTGDHRIPCHWLPSRKYPVHHGS